MNVRRLIVVTILILGFASTLSVAKSGYDGDSFFSELFTHVGQWGTHVDPPAHFVKGLRTVDQIDDVHEEVAKIPDYTLSIERLKKWETDHGRIPASAFGAMRTD